MYNIVNAEANVGVGHASARTTEVMSDSQSNLEDSVQITSTPVKKKPPPLGQQSTSSDFSLPSAIFGSPSESSSSQEKHPLDEELNHHIQQMEEIVVSSEDISEGELDTQLEYHLNQMEQAAANMQKKRKNKFFTSMVQGKFPFIIFLFTILFPS